MTTGIIAVVRDKNGNVKFDDWNNIPQSFYPALTESDWQHIASKKAEIK